MEGPPRRRERAKRERAKQGAREACAIEVRVRALSNKRLKLAARFFKGMIAFVRPYSSLSALGCGAPGSVGRRSLGAIR
jgi:hypothetical protein